MPTLDRRNLFCTGIALALLLGAMPLLAVAQQSTDASEDAPGAKDGKQQAIQVHYLEIVTPEVDELCKQYSKIHGVTFSEPNASFGNARTAKLNGGGLIGIRAPMRETETPVVRPYTLVKDLEASVAKAADAGAEVAIPRMEIPGGHGAIAIVIRGGIECGLWQR